MDISGYAEVRALYGDQAEEVGRYRGYIWLFGADGEGLREDGMPFGGHCASCERKKRRQACSIAYMDNKEIGGRTRKL